MATDDEEDRRRRLGQTWIGRSETPAADRKSSEEAITAIQLAREDFRRRFGVYPEPGIMQWLAQWYGEGWTRGRQAERDRSLHWQKRAQQAEWELVKIADLIRDEKDGQG